MATMRGLATPVLVAAAVVLVPVAIGVAASIAGPGTGLGEWLLPVWIVATVTAAPAVWVASVGLHPARAWLVLAGLVATSTLMLLSEAFFAVGVDADSGEGTGSSLPWLAAGGFTWLATWATAFTSLMPPRRASVD
jgi:hypothetical protein